MAKIVITLEDSDDGMVDMSVDFDPPVHRDQDYTPAQCMAGNALMAIRQDTELETEETEESPEEELD